MAKACHVFILLRKNGLFRKIAEQTIRGQTLNISWAPDRKGPDSPLPRPRSDPRPKWSVRAVQLQCTGSLHCTQAASTVQTLATLLELQCTCSVHYSTLQVHSTSVWDSMNQHILSEAAKHHWGHAHYCTKRLWLGCCPRGLLDS